MELTDGFSWLLLLCYVCAMLSHTGIKEVE